MKVPFVSDTSEVWYQYKHFTGELAFDIGANGGMVTEVLAPHFTTVVAFEPCAESCEELRALALDNVIVNQAAVSDVDGTVTLSETDVSTGRFGELVTDPSKSPIGHYWGAETGERVVPAVTLDTLFDLYGAPDFIKIDTEGHEAHIVVGGMASLKKHLPTLLIEVHAGHLGSGIQAMLPEYRWTRFNHEVYEARNSPLVNEHYWLRGEK